MDRQIAMKNRSNALRELRDFEEQHASVFNRQRELVEKIEEWSWPPQGHHGCDSEAVCCSAVFKGDLPEGWVQEIGSCGDLIDNHYCPNHVDEVEHYTTRCLYCAN